MKPFDFFYEIVESTRENVQNWSQTAAMNVRELLKSMPRDEKAFI